MTRHDGPTGGGLNGHPGTREYDYLEPVRHPSGYWVVAVLRPRRIAQDASENRVTRRPWWSLLVQEARAGAVLFAATAIAGVGVGLLGLSWWCPAACVLGGVLGVVCSRARGRALSRQEKE